jgi:hypothetical protein
MVLLRVGSEAVALLVLPAPLLSTKELELLELLLLPAPGLNESEGGMAIYPFSFMALGLNFD